MVNEIRLYGFCAKGGHEKERNTHYVCDDHQGPGAYTNCAVCGIAWDRPSWDYVCWDDLVRKPEVVQ